VHGCYIGNGVGNDWFSEKVNRANLINGVWSARMGGAGIVARVTPQNSEELEMDLGGGGGGHGWSYKSALHPGKAKTFTVQQKPEIWT
jgi:hypothetical protein